jgi:hypothetical protein
MKQNGEQIKTVIAGGKRSKPGFWLQIVLYKYRKRLIIK